MSGKMKKATTYEEALSRPSRDVWPGCGDGRCRSCGGVHDFCYMAGYGKDRRSVHQIECLQRRQFGCPQPNPEPKHRYEKGRCVKCRRPAGWNGFKRSQLVREDAVLPFCSERSTGH